MISPLKQVTSRLGKRWRGAISNDRLDRRFTPLSSADANHVRNLSDEDFPIAEFACPGCLNDCLNGEILYIVRDDHFDLYLGHELDLILRTAIGFCMALLPAISLDLADRHTYHVNFL